MALADVEAIAAYIALDSATYAKAPLGFSINNQQSTIFNRSRGLNEIVHRALGFR